MPAKQMLSFLESCKQYKYFFSVRGRAGPPEKSPDRAWRTGTTVFFNFTGQGGPWHGVFWQISGRAGRDRGNRRATMLYCVFCIRINATSNNSHLFFFCFTGVESIRYMFAFAGVQYEDERIENEDWPALKPSKAPFLLIIYLNIPSTYCISNQTTAFQYFII